MKKILFLVTLFLVTGSFAAVAAEVPRMSQEELQAQLSSGEIVVLDARSGKDWKSSQFKIKGALRTPTKTVDEWVNSIPTDKKLVIYCA
ncbi:putative sulfurtransferase [Candidatus Electrothrix aarhusensis]|jgi:rhodanese-related sulfurtransferase|uniref:Putative sulfurtransferase n=1 Tax=Candidatus Electrothrix aarhusensis TaxID=1859131 RepID=A0A3S3U8U1_9BACT|nr:putative sulfurtransferase [Candidatus Electrothrix aarhusensis]